MLTLPSTDSFSEGTTPSASSQHSNLSEYVTHLNTGVNMHVCLPLSLIKTHAMTYRAHANKRRHRRGLTNTHTPQGNRVHMTSSGRSSASPVPKCRSAYKCWPSFQTMEVQLCSSHVSSCVSMSPTIVQNFDMAKKCDRWCKRLNLERLLTYGWKMLWGSWFFFTCPY